MIPFNLRPENRSRFSVLNDCQQYNRRNFVYKQMTASRHSDFLEFLHLQQLVEPTPGEETMKLFLAVLLATITVGCGYSSKTTTPAQPGTTPAITQLTPAATNAGAPAFMLEVDGSKFNANATVNFGATKITNPTFVNSGKLQAMVPATSVTSAGVVHVTVTNPGTPGGLYGGGTQAETSTAMDFTVN
jgi:hypothetical protein